MRFGYLFLYFSSPLEKSFQIFMFPWQLVVETPVLEAQNRLNSHVGVPGLLVLCCVAWLMQSKKKGSRSAWETGIWCSWSVLLQNL